ncbi:MAG: protein kinase [Enhydrobacter sp.]|nr:protein kinase [Enhydrobacter sp.]
MTVRGSSAAPPIDFDALPIGSRIARYEVKGVLGQGGFGITYLALDEQLGREVAIKEYLPSLLAIRRHGADVMPRSAQMADEFNWGRERFVAEARILATLYDAPGVVRVHDFLEANGTAYMIMECVQGRTLEKVLAERTRLGPGEIATILEPLLLGLERVHAAGFLHRDIKPANILLRPDGRPTLIDFGASRAAAAGMASATTAIFTPGYSAPEQITSANQGPWTDIYSLAATLHRAITGALPPSSFERLLDDQYQPLLRRAPAGFELALLAGVDAGLVLRPARRPQTIAAWRDLFLQQPSPPRVSMPVSTDLHAGDDTPTVAMFPSRASLALGTASRTRGARPTRSLLQASLGVGLAAALGGGAWLVLEDRSLEAKRGSAAIEVASLHQAAEDSRRSAVTEAEARRQPEQALAGNSGERRAAEEEKRRQLELRAAAELEARKRAEAAEAALGLMPSDRALVQVALASLGFDAGGVDGAFGSRSREMIAGWQKARNQPPTGFLTDSQKPELLREAAAAVQKFEEEQRKKADESAARKAGAGLNAPAATSLTPGTVQPVPVAASIDGSYAGALTTSTVGGPLISMLFNATFTLANGRVTGEVNERRCGTFKFSLPSTPAGEFAGRIRFPEDASCSTSSAEITGKIAGDLLKVDIRAQRVKVYASLKRTS